MAGAISAFSAHCKLSSSDVQFLGPSMQLHLYGARARRASHCKIVIAFRREVNFPTLAYVYARQRENYGKRRGYLYICTDTGVIFKETACTACARMHASGPRARMLRLRNRDGDVTSHPRRNARLLVCNVQERGCRSATD